jgi:hypothetical protein
VRGLPAQDGGRDGAQERRCAARTLAPGSAALADHPNTVNLREDVIVEALNRWIGRLFHPENVDQTVAELLGSQPAAAVSIDVGAAKARRREAEQRLQRFQDAIAAGVDPVALVEPMNQAQADKVAAQARSMPRRSRRSRWTLPRSTP